MDKTTQYKRIEPSKALEIEGVNRSSLCVSTPSQNGDTQSKSHTRLEDVLKPALIVHKISLVEIISTIQYARCETKCVISPVHQHQQKALGEQSPEALAMAPFA